MCFLESNSSYAYSTSMMILAWLVSMMHQSLPYLQLHQSLTQLLSLIHIISHKMQNLSCIMHLNF